MFETWTGYKTRSEWGTPSSAIQTYISSEQKRGMLVENWVYLVKFLVMFEKLLQELCPELS